MMRATDKILLAIAAVLVVAALFLVFTRPDVPTQDEEKENAARELFIKAVDIGKGQENYYYSYTEVENQFSSTYSLLKKWNQSMIEIENILSRKQIYFLEEDTILCIEYNNQEEVCSSVENETDLENYLDSIDRIFFDDQRIEDTKTNMEYFERYNYIIFDPETKENTVDGHPCVEFNYQFDFNNMSVYEASRFGIGTYTPKEFFWTMCADKTTGEIYEKSVEYTQNGVEYRNSFKLVSSEWGTSKTIVAPENLTKGAVDILIEEKTQQTNIVGCYLEQDVEDQERCLAVIALNIRNKDICGLTEERKDRCLVSIVPLTKDESICLEIEDKEFKDDCYIEMTGATGNKSYCEKIVNSSKNEFCMNLTVTESGSDTGVEGSEEEFVHDDSDIEEFVMNIYEREMNENKNQTNVTES